MNIEIELMYSNVCYNCPCWSKDRSAIYSALAELDYCSMGHWNEGSIEWIWYNEETDEEAIDDNEDFHNNPDWIIAPKRPRKCIDKHGL